VTTGILLDGGCKASESRARRRTSALNFPLRSSPFSRICQLRQLTILGDGRFLHEIIPLSKRPLHQLLGRDLQLGKQEFLHFSGVLYSVHMYAIIASWRTKWPSALAARGYARIVNRCGPGVRLGMMRFRRSRLTVSCRRMRGATNRFYLA